MYVYYKLSTFVCVLFNCYKIAARLKIFHKLEKMKRMKSICTFGKMYILNFVLKLILNKEYVCYVTLYVFSNMLIR